MKAKRWSILVAVLAVLAIVGGSLVFVQSSQASARQNTRGLVGGWMITVTFDEVYQMPPQTTPAVITLDGLIINTGQTGTASVGMWELVKDRVYAITFYGCEMMDGTPITFKVRTTLNLNKAGDQADGAFVNDIFDLEGNLLFSVTGTVHGERFSVEPLD